MAVRVERHPRGHIASCNGRVELVNARAEVCPASCGEASDRAAWVDGVEKEERQRKTEMLRSFQRDVKRRVALREQAKQRQIAASCHHVLQSEQRVAEKAMVLEHRSEQRSGEQTRSVGAGDEAVRVSVFTAAPLAAAQARQAMLSKKTSGGSVLSPSELCPQEKPAQHSYTEVASCVRGDSTPQSTPSNSHRHKRSKTPDSVVRRFVPSGQLEVARQRAAGQQFLTFRRLYSALEREQARQHRQLRQHREQVQRDRVEKEAGRRQAEWETRAVDSFSIVGSETANDEEERVREWAELLALEQRRERLQRDREQERYIEALRGQLRDRLSQSKSPLPLLCSCGASLWQSGPQSCANNCVFYRNPREYAKALSNLLLSLDS